jgi:hypothetical protein
LGQEFLGYGFKGIFCSKTENGEMLGEGMATGRRSDLMTVTNKIKTVDKSSENNGFANLLNVLKCF